MLLCLTGINLYRLSAIPVINSLHLTSPDTLPKPIILAIYIHNNSHFITRKFKTLECHAEQSLQYGESSRPPGTAAKTCTLLIQYAHAQCYRHCDVYHGQELPYLYAEMSTIEI